MNAVYRPAMVVVSLGIVAAAGHPAAQSPASPVAQVRQRAYLKASNADAHDHFGCGGAFDGHAGWGTSLSGDGNTLVVGAPHESSNARGVNGNQAENSLHGAGAAYVFVRNGAGWTQQAYLKASNPQMSAEFGHAVAISADGHTIAVSAFWEASAATGINGNQNDESVPQAGAVYVFTRRGTTWTQQAYVKASNTGEPGTADSFGDGDQLGVSIALSDDGNTLAVGSHSEDGNGVNDNQKDNSVASAGAVYVFNRTGANWAQTAYVKAPNPDGGDMFGYSVSLNADGRTLAVGAFDEDGDVRGPAVNGPYNNARGGAGAVYVFVKGTAGTWVQQAYLHALNNEGGDSFGVAVSLSDDGNTLLVGSLDEDCEATGVNPSQPCDNDRAADISTGAAYVFVRAGNAWTQQAFLKPSNTGANDWFGSRLVLSGDGNTAVVPAPLEDGRGQGINGSQEDGAQESGAVYLFIRRGTTWTQDAYVKGASTEAFDQFGGSVGVSRDGRTFVATAYGEDSGARRVNGDQADNKVEEAGAAYVFGVTAGAAIRTN
jgi:hypothetical protein